MKVVTEEGEDATVPASMGEKKRKPKSHISSCLCNSWAGRIGDKMVMRRLKSLSQRKPSCSKATLTCLKQG